MTTKLLNSSALSAFCGSVATMLSAGIQTDEAVYLLSENHEESRFQEVCSVMFRRLVSGSSFSEAMRATEGFPAYAVEMAATGEQSGHLEQVLRNLELYYDEEDRAFDNLRSSVGYPALLLTIMALILLLTVLYILPVFTGVYHNMEGALSAQSALAIQASQVIGWVSLVITVICAAVAIYLSSNSRSEEGHLRVVHIFEKLRLTKDAMYHLALSRFMAVLAALVSSGVTHEEAMGKALATVDHDKLRDRLAVAHDSMLDLDNPRSLVQALSENGVFEPLYARMLNVGMRSGSTDETLARLSQAFFDDAVVQIDESVDRIEPLLAAFLTLAIGATLIAVMLPLIGIMGSI